MQINSLKQMILLLESQCSSLYQICRREGKFVTSNKSYVCIKKNCEKAQWTNTLTLHQVETTEDRTTNFAKHTNIATQTKIVLLRLNSLIGL